jgi:hypothetical protein
MPKAGEFGRSLGLVKGRQVLAVSCQYQRLLNPIERFSTGSNNVDMARPDTADFRRQLSGLYQARINPPEVPETAEKWARTRHDLAHK